VTNKRSIGGWLGGLVEHTADVVSSEFDVSSISP